MAHRNSVNQSGFDEEPSTRVFTTQGIALLQTGQIALVIIGSAPTAASSGREELT